MALAEKKEDTILAVRDLKTFFNTDDGIVKAVDGISFTLHKGETLGLVGESGCGKSVSCLSLLKLIPSPPGKIVSGKIEFAGNDILGLNEEEMREIRGKKISMIFQDPMTSLNPFLKISTQMTETISLHQSLNKKESLEKAVRMLFLVGIPKPEKRIHDYPHQFSGGMRQRVMIAMALSCHPGILIADEPTTALDVTIQAQILDIIKELTSKTDTAVILITHDLGIVAGMCDHICVMYAGKIIEKASAPDLFRDPKHPYTRGLIKSVPRVDKPQKERLYSIEGQPPNLIDLPDACAFHPRCEQVMDICRKKFPPEISLHDRSVCCYLYEKES
ncbi:MAG: ABC transporter ATP-binding protein [Spirochaetales bacterium]|nr:ABC transporter ATP-binding protein [Spirochaetales bacterium]